MEEKKVEEKVENSVKKKSKGKWIVLLLILFGNVGYFGKKIFDDYENQKFFKGIYINGIEVEGLTVAQVEEKIKAKVESYRLELKFRENVVETINSQELGYRYVSDNNVAKIQREQKWYNWFLGDRNKEEFTVGEAFSYDEAMLEKALLSLHNLLDENQVVPKDAYIDFEEGQFVVIPEDEGKELDKLVVKENLKNAVERGANEIDVEEIGAYKRPDIFSTSEELVSEVENLNNVVKIAITLELHDNSLEILDGKVLKDWLSTDDDGQYYFDMDDLSSELKKYLESLAERIDTVGKDRIFESTMQGTKTVKGGAYGYQLNQKSELEQLKDDIVNQRVISREPIYQVREVSSENDGIGDTYVEIDLTNQKVWFYIEGELYMESACVSGTFVDRRKVTPEGTYALYYKERNRVLRGRRQADGTFEYESPVSYWMPFNRGIGLHDATWRRSFGGEIYRRNGSHGCINLPLKKAAEMYAKLNVGTPIVVFY